MTKPRGSGGVFAWFDFQYRKWMIFRKPLFLKRCYSHCKFLFRKMGRGAEKLFLKTPFFFLSLYIGQLRNSRPEPSACMTRRCPVISKWMHMPKHPWFLKTGCLSPETVHQCSVCERAGVSHESTNKLRSKTLRKLWNFRCLSVHTPFMLKAVQSGLTAKFGSVRATFRLEMCPGVAAEQCWETGKSNLSFLIAAPERKCF